jgi:hypothetical protein
MGLPFDAPPFQPFIGPVLLPLRLHLRVWLGRNNYHDRLGSSSSIFNCPHPAQFLLDWASSTSSRTTGCTSFHTIQSVTPHRLIDRLCSSSLSSTLFRFFGAESAEALPQLSLPFLFDSSSFLTDAGKFHLRGLGPA